MRRRRGASRSRAQPMTEITGRSTSARRGRRHRHLRPGARPRVTSDPSSMRSGSRQLGTATDCSRKRTRSVPPGGRPTSNRCRIAFATTSPPLFAERRCGHDPPTARRTPSGMRCRSRSRNRSWTRSTDCCGSSIEPGHEGRSLGLEGQSRARATPKAGRWPQGDPEGRSLATGRPQKATRWPARIL